MTMLLGAVRAGDVLARKYRVERILGAGGMGVVVAARHELLRELVAIKLLSPERSLDKSFVRRFLSEARSTAKLKSEHVARLMDVGTLDEGTPYLVMELLEGHDLACVLNDRGPLPPARAVDYMLQACSGLAEAHRHGIVHRDLKPANLFLTTRPDGSPLVKVLDFGLAKRFDDSVEATKTGQLVGSPNYMSPEQVSAPSSVDARVDVWALGVILYELVTGTRPFAGNTVSEIFALILHGNPPPLRERAPSLSPDLEAVINCCLEKDRERRFDNVESLSAALARFATGAAALYAPASAHSTGPSPAIESTLLLALSPTMAGATSLALGGGSLSSTAIVAAPAFTPQRAPTPEPPISPVRASAPAPSVSRALTPVPSRALTPIPPPSRVPAPPPAMPTHEGVAAFPASHPAPTPRSADAAEPWANSSQVNRSQAWVWPLRAAITMALLAGTTLVVMRSRHLIAARRDSVVGTAPSAPSTATTSAAAPGQEGAAKPGASKLATSPTATATSKPAPGSTAPRSTLASTTTPAAASISAAAASPSALASASTPAPTTLSSTSPRSAGGSAIARPTPPSRPAPRPAAPARRNAEAGVTATVTTTAKPRDEKAELFNDRTW
jgi:eukaryotic-like serine/threonine-protein kinase